MTCITRTAVDEHYLVFVSSNETSLMSVGWKKLCVCVDSVASG